MATNSWLTPGPQASNAAADVAHEPAAPAPPTHPLATGPVAPQPTVPVPDAAYRLRRRLVETQAIVWWVGVHGGAGETTLEQLLDGSRAAGHAWPQPVSGGTVPVVLVARSNWRGLTAAQHAATEWASGNLDNVELLGLVIIADAPGKLPRPLKDLGVLVAGGVPRVWHVPWVETWRLGEDVAETSAPKEVRGLLDDVRALVPIPTHAPQARNER